MLPVVSFVSICLLHSTLHFLSRHIGFVSRFSLAHSLSPFVISYPYFYYAFYISMEQGFSTFKCLLRAVTGVEYSAKMEPKRKYVFVADKRACYYWVGKVTRLSNEKK